VTFEFGGRRRVGLVEGGHVRPVEHDPAGGLRALIADGGFRSPRPRDEVLPLEAVELLPPVPDSGKILCVGVNYRTHMEEIGLAPPDWPAIFARFNDGQVGHRQPVRRPRTSDQFDFEGELAVIIGRAARCVSPERALDLVAGYACFADNSLRDLQGHSRTAMSGKISPGSGGFGPWMVTADEIADPGDLELVTRLNGAVVQHGRTSDMIFSVPALISYISSITRLEPGDVIATGTPAGVGSRRQPPLWMRPGDVLEVEISGIGRLTHAVVDEADAA
jgi:2-keto-4-pentenoate hydratase/2-oxohepta-3-ene-1,7-dioic acid hydratase in catechol pathway